MSVHEWRRGETVELRSYSLFSALGARFLFVPAE